MSQGVLLSLLQQLGTDLAFLPATVLPWIREAALALDPQVPLATHVLAAVLSTSLMVEHATLHEHCTAVLPSPPASCMPTDMCVCIHRTRCWRRT